MAYAAIVQTGQRLVLPDMHADCYSLRINIYSESRSVVINRKAAGEILLPFSLESPAALQVSGQLAMEMSHSHMSTQHVRWLLMKMCVSACVCIHIGNPVQIKSVNKCYNCIMLFSLPEVNWIVNYCCR